MAAARQRPAALALVLIALALVAATSHAKASVATATAAVAVVVTAQNGTATDLCDPSPATVDVIRDLWTACPGRYCGRRLGKDNCLPSPDASCGICPPGTRTDGYICLPCSESVPAAYEVTYLVFWVATVSVLHLTAWLATYRPFRHISLILLVSIVVEVTTAALLAMISVHPLGSLKLRMCPVESLTDWYTIFADPGSYGAPIYCSSEAVYPLWTIVFLFLMYSILLVLLVRVPVSVYFCNGAARASIYGALVFLPVLALINAIFAGLLYYSFPYILLVIIALKVQPSAIFSIRDAGLLYEVYWERILAGALRYSLMAFAILSINIFFAPPEQNVVAAALSTTLGPLLIIGFWFGFAACWRRRRRGPFSITRH